MDNETKYQKHLIKKLGKYYHTLEEMSDVVDVSLCKLKNLVEHDIKVDIHDGLKLLYFSKK